jgi:hypothetical protein
MSSKKSFVRSLVSAALFAQALTAGVALADVNEPDDEFASPKPGEQAPGLLLPPEGDLPTSGPLEFKDNRDISYGNAVWGGGYRIYSNVRAPSLTFQSVNADLQARAKLFGTTMTVFQVGTGTWNPRDNLRSTRINVSIANKEVCYDTETSEVAFSTVTASCNVPEIDKKAFGGERGFGIGPVSIDVKGEVKVKAKANVSAKAYRLDADTSGATFTGHIEGRAYGVLGTSVDIWLAEAGVTGNVEFVKVIGDVSLKSERDGYNVNYDTTIRAQVCSLGGNVNIWVDTPFYDGNKTILNWEGVCHNRDWGKGHGTTYMGPTRVFEPRPIIIGALAP